MKRAAVATSQLLAAVSAAIGLDGAFLVAGTALVAVGSYFAVSSDAPWFVVGGMCLIVWLALTQPWRR